MIERIAGMWLALAVLGIPITSAQDQPPERDLSFFLHRLRTVDHLPELEASGSPLGIDQAPSSLLTK